jgi:hypothetical protein
MQKRVTVLRRGKYRGSTHHITLDFETSSPKTIVDILKVPTTARTKRIRNKKLSFGIMSDKESVNAVDTLVESEREADKRAESEKILDTNG